MCRVHPRACLATILWLASACGESTSASSVPANVQELRSDKPRETPAAANVDGLVSGNTAFAWDLYGQVAKMHSDNLFMSPLSLSLALAMTYEGARGNTESQMKSALHFDLERSELHQAFNALDQELALRSKPVANAKPFRLRIVNKAWGQTGFAFAEPFLDVLAQNYGASVFAIDFSSRPSESRQTINDWVSAQTEGKIPDLLPEGSIAADTRLVLTNAVYFNASWKHPFDTKNSASGEFKTVSGTSAPCTFMQLSESLKYSEGTGFKAVELPYDGDQLSMLIVVPNGGSFSDVESDVGARFAAASTTLATRLVTLKLPKFVFRSEFSAKEALMALGMTDAFSAADFSGIAPGAPLVIDDVLHQGFVNVDEAGTEAAAATAVTIRETSAPEPVELTIDRPFLFAIRDLPTGAILFVGRMLMPSAPAGAVAN